MYRTPIPSTLFLSRRFSITSIRHQLFELTCLRLDLLDLIAGRSRAVSPASRFLPPPNLSMKGKTTDEMVRSAAREASLHAHGLTLEIGDIDKELSRYEFSQSFNLVDVCAFFFAGPSVCGHEGIQLCEHLQSAGGSSQIRTLVSKWIIEHGVAQAKDVAMATKENRIALKEARFRQCGVSKM